MNDTTKKIATDLVTTAALYIAVGAGMKLAGKISDKRAAKKSAK